MIERLRDESYTFEAFWFAVVAATAGFIAASIGWTDAAAFAQWVCTTFAAASGVTKVSSQHQRSGVGHVKPNGSMGKTDL